jgi:hypothetical protein
MVAKVETAFWGGINAQRLQEELDRQGTQGWELVQVVNAPSGWGALHLVFKKPG